MKVKIQRMNSLAKIPTQAHSKDFCYDVYATSCKRVGWRKWEYGIGLAFEIVRGPIDTGTWQSLGLKTWDGTNFHDIVNTQSMSIEERFFNNVKIDLDFRPRSSVHKTGMVLSNCVGTIDELYRGEVKAYFYRVTFGKRYKVGDRIGQVKLGFTLPIEWEVVDKVNSNTERGTKGFGSSGR